MYPYGGSATRVPLRSDTNKVVVPFFQALFLHLVEFVILKRRVSEQENAGKMMVHIRLYTPIVETQHTEDGCATPMQHQVARTTVHEFRPGFSAFGVPPPWMHIPVCQNPAFRYVLFCGIPIALPRNSSRFFHPLIARASRLHIRLAFISIV
jgi:hypothetical protein